MRTKKLFMLSAVLLALMSSCGNEEEVSKSSLDKNPVTVSLQLAAKSVSTTRATGVLPTNMYVTGSNADEAKVNRVTIGAFNSTSNVVTIYEQAIDQTLDATTVSVNFNSTAEASKVIVITNAPKDWFKGITTETDFKAKAAQLAYTTSADGTSIAGTLNSQKSTALPMYSSETSLAGTTTKTTAETISLTRMVARIAITSITTSFSSAGLYPGATFTPKEIFMYNANTACNWDGSYTALSASNSAESTEGTFDALIEKTSLSELAYLSSGKMDDFYMSSDPVYFYVFPNSNDGSHPTKLVIKGVWTYDGISEIVYYPVIINHSQIGTTINNGTEFKDGATYPDDEKVVANTQYALTAKITSKGVSSADQDITPAAISLNVKVTDWSTASQDVTF